MQREDERLDAWLMIWTSGSRHTMYGIELICDFSLDDEYQRLVWLTGPDRACPSIDQADRKLRFLSSGHPLHKTWTASPDAGTTNALLDYWWRVHRMNVQGKVTRRLWILMGLNSPNESWPCWVKGAAVEIEIIDIYDITDDNDNGYN